MDFADKTGILGQLWIEFRDDEDFKNFIEYNDIGLPLAYFTAHGLVNELTPMGDTMIDETFDMLISLLEVTVEEIEDFDQVDLDTLLTFAYNKKQSKAKEE